VRFQRHFEESYHNNTTLVDGQTGVEMTTGTLLRAALGKKQDVNSLTPLERPRHDFTTETDAGTDNYAKFQ
jgi:hypothetical protein